MVPFQEYKTKNLLLLKNMKGKTKTGDSVKKAQNFIRQPVFLIAVGTILGAVVVFFLVYQLTKPKTGKTFTAKACGPYAYCRATNQDDSGQYGTYDNQVRMNNYQFEGFKEWLRVTDRVANGSLEPRVGNRLQAFAQGRPFTDAEMRSLLEVIQEPDTQGRIFLQLDGDKLIARLNDRVLDYSTPVRFSSELDNKLTVLSVVFEDNECPLDPCANAIDIVN